MPDAACGVDSWKKKTSKTKSRDFFVQLCFVPAGFLGLSTVEGGERHIGQDGQGRAGQLRGHGLAVLNLAAELPSRQG